MMGVYPIIIMSEAEAAAELLLVGTSIYIYSIERERRVDIYGLSFF